MPGIDLQRELLKQQLTIEYAALRSPGTAPYGVYVLPDEQDILTWHGVIFLHRGPYAGGIFRFRLRFVHYPTSTPELYLPRTLLHPLVDPHTGKFHTEHRFPDWKPRRDYVFHLLHYLKACFKRDGLEQIANRGEHGSVNKEVYMMYRDNPALFAKLASQSVSHSASSTALFDSASPSLPGSSSPDSDSHIRFSMLDPVRESKLRDMIYGRALREREEAEESREEESDVERKLERERSV